MDKETGRERTHISHHDLPQTCGGVRGLERWAQILVETIGRDVSRVATDVHDRCEPIADGLGRRPAAERGARP